MSRNPLYRSVELAATITDRVLVSFSAGKDSVVTLDLAVKHFKRVDAFFMYLAGGLRFQDGLIRYYEDKYGLAIHRVPHFMLSEWLRYGTYRQSDFDVPIVSVKEVYDYVRELSGTWWIAGGERVADSVWRRAVIKNSGSIDENRGRFYPLADWNKAEVLAYIRQRRLKVGVESERLGFSFRSLMPLDMIKIREAFPRDFETIKLWFPLVETGIKHHEFFGKTSGDAAQ